MPGKILLHNSQVEDNFMTTSDVFTNHNISLLVNRDSNNHAEGKIFLDHGESVSELVNKLYEHFEIIVNQKSIKKLNLNSDSISKNFTLSNIVIANAADL